MICKLDGRQFAVVFVFRNTNLSLILAFNLYPPE
jgi:hypothetical protein